MSLEVTLEAGSESYGKEINILDADIVEKVRKSTQNWR